MPIDNQLMEADQQSHRSTFPQKIIKAIKNPKLAVSVLSKALGRLAPTPSEFVHAEGLRSASESDGLYLKIVDTAVKNYKAFGSFKSHPLYRIHLEHVPVDQGQTYLDIIRQQTPEFIGKIDLIRLNDLIGNPQKCYYDLTGSISPTTLRYAKVASDLKVLFGDLHNFSIVEVGCGYGGQMLIIDQLFKIKDYLLFDLPPVLRLISKYLESHLLNSCYAISTLNQYSDAEEYDLVISNYAFSELPAALQIKYIEKVLSKAKRGYLTMNSGLPDSVYKNRLNVADLKKYLPNIEILDEKPLTATGNYIICWGHTETIQKIEKKNL